MTPEQRARMRARILDAARDRFLKEGLDGLSMRGIASKVGVSSMTLYLYYESRQDIVRHIVAEGFRMLNDALAGHADVAEPRERLQKLEQTYLRFALEHPRYYAAMFQFPLDGSLTSNDPLLSRPSGEALRLFQETLTELRGSNGMGSTMRAAALWSALHGLAMLSIGGKLDRHGVQPNDVHNVITDMTQRLVAA